MAPHRQLRLLRGAFCAEIRGGGSNDFPRTESGAAAPDAHKISRLQPPDLQPGQPGAAAQAEDLDVFVGLGSNLGDSAALLQAAATALAALPGVGLRALSPLYRTQPQGFADQPFFLNGVARLDCPATLTPIALLDKLLTIEADLGRDRSRELRHGPRPLDLDLLLFGNRVMTGRRLILPHPRMLERAFVLVPLMDLVPDLVLPGGRALGEALAALDYRLQGDMIFQGKP